MLWEYITNDKLVFVFHQRNNKSDIEFYTDGL